MALQVWLPLTKNLENQGLSDAKVSLLNGTASFVEGKMGNAFYNNEDSRNPLIPWTHAHTEELSILLWVKPETPGAWMDIFSIGKYANRLETNGDNYYYFFHDDVGLYENDEMTSINVGGIPNETWSHIAFTVSGTELKFYINGNLVSSRSQVHQLSEVMDSEDVIRIGRRRDTEFSWYQALYNDIRIYDNCLSAKEIKEISKGLCCHYTLNSIPNENLVSGCYSCTSTKDSFSSTGTVITHVSADMLNDNRGKTLCLSYRVKSDGDHSYESDVVADWAKNRFGLHGAVIYTDSNGTGHNAYPLADLLAVGKEEGRYFTTWTIPTSSEYTFVDNLLITNQTLYHGYAHPASTNDETWYLDQVKLEWGTKPTPWCPHSTDKMYQTLGFDNLIEPDISGFGNNGYATIDATPSFDYDSPRYDSCYSFLSKHYLIGKTPWGNVSVSEFTISMWVNRESGGSYSTFFTSYGYGLPGLWLGMNIENCGLWSYRGGVSPLYGRSGGGNIPTNTWHHVVYVFDSGNVTWYLNGIKKLTTKFDGFTIDVGESFVIGDNYDGIRWDTHFIGKISDFRWYATALSADDIKKLYDTPISITDNGTLLIQGEFKEEE